MPLNTKEKILKELDDEEEINDEVHTDNDERCLIDMIGKFEGIEKSKLDGVSLDVVENQASECVRCYVEECFEIVKRYKKGEITLQKTRELDEIAFRG